MTQKKEVPGVESKGDTHLLDLVDEAVELPEVGVIRLVAVERAKLIVVVVLDTCRRKVGVGRLEVLVGRGRAAVQKQQLRGGVVAEALGPDMELPFRGGDRDPPRAAAEDVVPTGVIQVCLGAHRLSCWVRGHLPRATG